MLNRLVETHSSRGAGYYCELCDCVLKDSIGYLDHINGRRRTSIVSQGRIVCRAANVCRVARPLHRPSPPTLQIKRTRASRCVSTNRPRRRSRACWPTSSGKRCVSAVAPTLASSPSSRAHHTIPRSNRQEEQKKDTGVKYDLKERMRMLEAREKQRKVHLKVDDCASHARHGRHLPRPAPSHSPCVSSFISPAPGRETREAQGEAARDGPRRYGPRPPAPTPRQRLPPSVAHWPVPPPCLQARLRRKRRPLAAAAATTAATRLWRRTSTRTWRP